MNRRPEQKILITLLLFFVVIILLLSFVIYPLFEGVRADHQKVITHNQELLQSKADQESAAEFEKIENVRAMDLKRLKDIFVDRRVPIAFLQFLEETAQALGLDIEKTAGREGTQQGDRWPSLEIRVAGDGRYQSVMAFLQKIENAPYLLDLQSLTMSPKREKGNADEISFTISLKIFTK